MKKGMKFIWSLTVVLIVIIASGASKSTAVVQSAPAALVLDNNTAQTVNMFVTHGHCSTPFTGKVYDLKVSAPARKDLGNPLENLKLSFEIDPYSFVVCAGDDLTARIKTPGLFIGVNDQNITFKSTNVYTMGLDWYQINGNMTIKGVEKEVKLFATGIRDSKGTKTSALVLQGQMNLFDWGIDYDKIVNGKSEPIATKWMYMNMKVKMPYMPQL